MGDAVQLKIFTNLLGSKNTGKIKEHLPRIDVFRRALAKKGNRVPMEDELRNAVGLALNNVYGNNRDLYLTLAKFASVYKGGVHVDTVHPFGESIYFVVSSDGRLSERLSLNGPAVAYASLNDYQAGKAAVKFHSAGEILGYKGYDGLSLLVMPQAIVKGELESLALHNFPGEKKPSNPHGIPDQNYKFMTVQNVLDVN